MLNDDADMIRKVSGLSPEQERRVRDFLQGAVHCWCRSKKNQWFSCRDLIGQDNGEDKRDWQETAMQELSSNNQRKQSADPYKQAAVDAGWLLKSVLRDERRGFDQGETKNGVKRYRWNGG